ncbi:sensor histidine kinase [Yinghuangia seranimata]|uniref:sensor histidine kinase n=1 Tax=Yinghuangia seranimata TaxID=408067 RepID=UPI00248CE414|nr:sensor histidine kinase [Yinghuangia seranimata]MDI2129126.1 sensor histidine kinase [Yinghuangia seranimata]
MPAPTTPARQTDPVDGAPSDTAPSDTAAAARQALDTAAAQQETPPAPGLPADARVADAQVEERWALFFRWGPYLLLAAATAVAAATRTSITSPTRWYGVAALTAAALALHMWWARTNAATNAATDAAAGATTTPPAPVARAPHRRAAAFYYAARYALAFALTWLNPFYAIYAVLGYFDADRLLPARLVRAALLATAVTMAGSQAGGLPPGSPVAWVAFGGLFGLNACLTLVLSHLSAQETENTRAKAAMIGDLAEANARLERALSENAGLHAQLLVQAREAGVAEERRRLAAEIHDTIAQGLAGIVTQLQAADDTADTDPDTARTHVRRAAALARDSLGEARRSVHGLSPRALEHDALPDALRKTVAAWADETGVRADLTVTGDVEPLHGEIEATLLRIAQEALANARRHAAASRVGVTLSYMGDEVTLDVRDDGRGFEPDALAPPGPGGGFGLGGMRARAERLAGTVEIESEPGQGTAVSARVPLVRHA